MEEKLIRMSKRTYLLWSAGLFFLYTAILLGVAIADPKYYETTVYQIIAICFFSTIGALGSGFVICGLIAVVRSFKSGYLVSSDLKYPALVFIALAIVGGSYYIFDFWAGVVEIIILLLCFAIVAMTKVVRLFRSRRDPSPSPSQFSNL